MYETKFGHFEAIPLLFSMDVAGKLKVEVEPVPLTEAETAWTRVEKGRRIVFTIWKTALSHFATEEAL
jgi:hypothetical protein